MDFHASLTVNSSLPLSELASQVGEALWLSFSSDDSGRYEEFPAYTADMLGAEVALLGAADGAPTTEYQLMIRTYVSQPDDEEEVDSVLPNCLSAQGRGN